MTRFTSLAWTRRSVTCCRCGAHAARARRACSMPRAELRAARAARASVHLLTPLTSSRPPLLSRLEPQARQHARGGGRSAAAGGPAGGRPGSRDSSQHTRSTTEHCSEQEAPPLGLVAGPGPASVQPPNFLGSISEQGSTGEAGRGHDGPAACCASATPCLLHSQPRRSFNRGTPPRCPACPLPTYPHPLASHPTPPHPPAILQQATPCLTLPCLLAWAP